MSRYDELARLAVDRSKSTHAQKEECEGTAGVLCRALEDYLESPVGRMAYRRITPEPQLGFAEETGAVAETLPKVTRGRDGFWYFGVQIYFEEPASPSYFGRHSILLGLKPRGEGVFLLRSKKDTEIGLANQKALEEFCSTLFEDIRAFLQTPVGEPSRPIGFVAQSIPDPDHQQEDAL